MESIKKIIRGLLDIGVAVCLIPAILWGMFICRITPTRTEKARQSWNDYKEPW